jgi:1-acyl-sn-glycerol-3-phosphate acyltransferase
MARNNIEKYSARYALLKKVAGFWHNNVFYRKIIVIGRENINPDHHLIFAPNHQNALMDALAVLFTHKGQPVFLARADIFKRKIVAAFLYFLKILPVYRIRDGFSTLKSNDEIFRKTVDVIKNKNGLVILPEGDHEGFRRLRQLKKGICRIAFQADESTGFKLKIKIIPVGIEYSSYSRFRQILTVVYGKPIEISEFFQIYREAPEKALNELRDRLAAEIKKLMVHIESKEDYEAIDELRNLINGKFSDDIKTPKLFRDRKLIEKLNQLHFSDHKKYERICSLSLQIKKDSESLNISYPLLEKKKHPLYLLIGGILFLIFAFPVWLLGNIFTLTFLNIPDLQIKKIRDPQFHATIRYVMSLALAFIFLPVYLILSLLLFAPWWLALIIFSTIPVSGLFSWNYSLLYRRIIGGFRIRKFSKNKNPDFITLKNNHVCLKQLVSDMQNEKK